MTEVLHGLDGPTRARVAALRAQGSFFWLDVSLSEATREELRDALAIPDRALSALSSTGSSETARTVLGDGECVLFALRCYVEPQARATTSGPRLRPVMVHVLVTREFVLTLHEERVSLPSHLPLDPREERSKGNVVYSVLDMMLASTFSALEQVELGFDAFATDWTDGRGGGLERAALRDTVVTLATMRRWLTAEQVVLERAGVEIGRLLGFGQDEERYFDRLGQQVDRLLGSVDAVASGMGMLFDLQLNERAYLVSVLAAIFVPLTLVTGYFGMNFGWLVKHIDSPIAFSLFGIILPIATGILSWRLVVRPLLMGDGREPSRR